MDSSKQTTQGAPVEAPTREALIELLEDLRGELRFRGLPEGHRLAQRLERSLAQLKAQ